MTVRTILLHIRIYCILSTVTLTGLSQGFRAEYTVRRGPASDVQCMSLLTGSSEDFPDEAFTASSSLHDRVQFQPAKARLTEVYGSNEHTSGHAWCPNSPIGESLQEWIQADFPHLVMISTIFTAGRGDGNVKEFMPSFVLRYQRESGGPWLEHTKLDGTRILKANSDPRNLARVTLDTVVTALRIRIYPYSRKSNQPVCLRFALLGCEFPDGVVTYSMTQGSSPQPVGHNSLLSDSGTHLATYNLRDLSYDGQRIGNSPSQLTDGMGQLMDNIAYLGNVTNPVPLHPGQPGFHFVGWQQPRALRQQQQLQQRQQLDPSGVQIDFKFDAVRKFSWLRLFTFDSVPLQARLFNRIAVAFSRDGANYGAPIEAFTSQANLIDPRSMEWLRLRVDDHRGQSMRPKRSHRDPSLQHLNIYTDHEFDGALVLQMSFDSPVGQYARLSLTGGDKWILLSEVQFNSTLATDEPVGVETKPIGKELTNGDSESLKVDGTAEEGRSQGNFGESSPQNNAQDTLVSKSGATSQDDGGQVHGAPKDSSPPDNQGLHAAVPDAGETPQSEMSLLTSDFNHVTLLPFIIVLACLLCLIPGVILLWFCSRRRCGTGRSPLYCHRKAFFHSSGNDPTTQSSNCAKEYSRHQEAATKLLATGAYTGGSNGAAAQLLTGLMQQQQQQTLHSPNHPANFTCSANMMHQTDNSSAANTVGTLGAAVKPSSAGNSFPPVSVRNNVLTGVILQCSPSSSCSSHTATPGTNTDCMGAVLPSPNQEARTSMGIGTAACIYAGAGDGSCMSPEYASASIFEFTPPPSDQVSTVLPPSAVPPTTSSIPPPSPPPPPLPPNRMEHLRPMTSLASVKNYGLPFANPSGGHPLLVPMLMNGSQSTTLGPMLGRYPTSLLAEDPSAAASTLHRRFQLPNPVPTLPGGENVCGPGVVGGGSLSNRLILLPQSSFDTMMPIGASLNGQVVPSDMAHQSSSLYQEIPGTRSIQARAPTAIYQSNHAGQLIVDPNQLPPDLQRQWRLANLHVPANTAGISTGTPSEVDAHWSPDGTVMAGSGRADRGAVQQQYHQHPALVNCLPPQPALTGLLPHAQVSTGPVLFPQASNGLADTYRVQTGGGYLQQSSAGNSDRKNSGSGNCDETGRLSLYSMCV